MALHVVRVNGIEISRSWLFRMESNQGNVHFEVSFKYASIFNRKKGCKVTLRVSKLNSKFGFRKVSEIYVPADMVVSARNNLINEYILENNLKGSLYEQ